MDVGASRPASIVSSRMTRSEFIQKAIEAAKSAKATGAPISIPIAVAQKALESNFGSSQLAREANNLGGVKAGSSWGGPVIELPTREWREADGTWYTTVARWRKYADWKESFEDYGALIAGVYPVAASRAEDARAFLEALIHGDRYSYATDPDYVAKVWSIVEQYNLLDLALDSDRLLIVFARDGSEAARVPLGSTDVLMRASADGRRVYVRPDEA